MSLKSEHDAEMNRLKLLSKRFDEAKKVNSKWKAK